MNTFSRERPTAILSGVLLVFLDCVAGCSLSSTRTTAPPFPTFPPLRHGVKAVFGPDGNDCGGDLQGRGRELAEGFHDLGIDLTRIEFKWAVVEARRGTYDWSELDQLIGFLHQHGVEPMLMLYCAPPWAMRGMPADEQLFVQRGEQNLYTVVWPRREYLPDFERFCETAARRYRGQARLFEFWNEPDGMAGPIVYHDRAGKAVDVRYGGDAKEYTLWLEHMYAAIKRGNPDAVVAAGSLCVHETRFIEAMYASGCREHCDAISLHPYASEGINAGWIEQCRRVMTRYGDWGKPIWLSEFGWDLGGEYDEKEGRWPSSAKRQAEIITATAPVIQSLPYITHAFWFTLNDWNTSQTGIDPTGTHRFGLMDLAGRRRPGFDALCAVVRRTAQLRRPAEMLPPQIIPPAHPLDAASNGHVDLTLSCWEPAYPPGPALSANGTDDKLLSLRAPQLAVGPPPLTMSAQPHSRDDRAVAQTRRLASCNVAMAVGRAAGLDADPLPDSYEVTASVGNGPEIRFPITVPAVAGFVSSGPEIDARFADWPSEWPIRDGPMKAAFAWNGTHLFFACVVQDPQHKQPYRGKDIWKGDCVEIGLDPLRDAVRGGRYDVNDSEYALALTEAGPVLWRYVCRPDSYVGQVEGASVAVRRDGQETLYEAAIPWPELGVADPADGRLIGTAIAACDWNGTKRTVHKFGDGLIGTKEPYRFASIRLVPDLNTGQK